MTQSSQIAGRWTGAVSAIVAVLIAAACASPGPAATQAQTNAPTQVPSTASAATPAAPTATAAGQTPAPPTVAPPTVVPPTTEPTTVPSEPVTLNVEDVSASSRDAVMEQLNKDFTAKYPNVTIKRVRSTFTDLQPKQAIEMAGPNPPDVIEVVVPNDTFAKLGNEGLLLNLDPYVDQYHWADKFPASLLDQGRFDAEGHILSVPHYGTYMVEDVVGIFYNKKKLEALGLQVPATWEDYVASLETAKTAGEIPIMLGNLEKWPVGHIYGTIYNRYATTEDINGWTFNTKPEVSWDSPPFLQATQVLQTWGQKEYFTPDFNAVAYDDAVARFGAGEGVYLPAGTWVLANLKDMAAIDDIGFFLPPPLKDDPDLRIEGGQGQFWAISGKSKNQAVAAAYLDFITSDRAGELLIENGGLPGFTISTTPTIPAGLYKEVYDALQTVNGSYTVSTYVDASTSTMLTTSGEGHQKLLAGQMTPEEFVASVQADHDAVYKK